MINGIALTRGIKTNARIAFETIYSNYGFGFKLIVDWPRSRYSLNLQPRLSRSSSTNSKLIVLNQSFIRESLIIKHHIEFQVHNLAKWFCDQYRPLRLEITANR